jgi:hypothetical protein
MIGVTGVGGDAGGRTVADCAVLLSRLVRAVADAGDGRALTWRVCHAVSGLLGADGGSITVGNSAVNRVTLCATGRRARLLDNLQDVLGEGPCRDAFDSGRPCEAPLRGAASWPRFIPAAEKIIGLGGVLWAVPMRAGGEVIGVISLYRLLPGTLAVPVDDAVFLADAAARLLLQDPLAFAMFTGPAEGGGWSSRALVNLAAGMVMSQLRVCAGDALAVLRSRAFATDAQLADVARQVVDRRLDLSAS